MLTSQTTISYQEWDDSTTNGQPDFLSWQDEGYQSVSQEIRNEGAITEYDALGRAFRTIDDNGRISETLYDKRGLAVETRSELPDENGEGVWLVSRTVYDKKGRAIYSTGSFPLGNTDPLVDGPERVTSYGYDILGRLVSVREDATPTNTTDDPQVETDYTFDPQGRMDTQTTTAGTAASVTTDYDYDALGRLDTQTDSDQSGNVLASYDYEVRADGKRTSLDETVWFDANDDDIRQAGEVKSTSYDWTYDDVGRLTDEAITHFDSGVSQAEKFEYDLTGNRTKLEKDTGYSGTFVPDEVFAYDYDAGDRLEFEYLDSDNNGTTDQTTAYAYDQTQQTEKAVTAGAVTVSKQIFGYNLQGRMASVTNEGYDSTAISVARTNQLQLRLQVVPSQTRQRERNRHQRSPSDIWTETSSTEFLADHHNHTGYTQTIRETTTNADGHQNDRLHLRS